MLNYTLIGGKGFLGSAIFHHLKEAGNTVYIPERNEKALFERELGTVIYCAGQGDCLNRPYEVLDAHALLLSRILQYGHFKRLIYISSTRLYMGQDNTKEAADLGVLYNDSRRLFNLTKLVGEELCLLSKRDVLILRPANVYGLALNSPLFLPAITRHAISNGKIDMYVSPEYAKDYVSVDDLVVVIYKLSLMNTLSQKIYNVASGVNVCASAIAAVLQAETGCDVNWVDGSVDEYFPLNDISALKAEIGFSPRYVLDDLKIMIDNFKVNLGDERLK